MSLKKAVGLLARFGEKFKTTRSLANFQKPSTDPREISFAVHYLEAFGYLPKELADWKSINLDDIMEAIKAFQNLFELKQDGHLCAKTIKMMEQPRCACPDILRPHHAQFLRVKEFAKQNLPAWTKRGLTYGVEAIPSGVDKDQFLAMLDQSFQHWTQHGNINTQRVNSGRADIIVGVGEGQRSNFDGPGGVLAWAYMPDGNDQPLNMKFDNSETWSFSPGQRGILIGNVATHEIGHLFGLDHSRVSSALMAPTYAAPVTVPQANDDIPRFQARYGIRTGDGGPVNPPPTNPPPTNPGGTRAMTILLPPGASVILDGQRIV
jgi:matrix metalloproteinase-14 (membrane-inserted)